MIYLVLILIMTLMGSVASLFLKRASGSENFLKMLANINLYIGGFLYVVAAFINIYVLKYLDYAVVLPLTSITYLWTMLLSYLILKEKITTKKVIGVVLILLGVICVAIK